MFIQRRWQRGVENWWNDTDRGNQKCWYKHCHFFHHKSHTARDRTWPSAVRGRRRTAGVTARPQLSGLTHKLHVPIWKLSHPNAGCEDDTYSVNVLRHVHVTFRLLLFYRGKFALPFVSLPHTLVVRLHTTLLGVSLDGPIWVSIIVLQQPCTVRALLKCCYLKTANRSAVSVSRYMARFWQYSGRKAMWFTIFSPVRTPWCNIRYHFHLQQHLWRNLVCPCPAAWKTVICGKVPVRFPPRADNLLYFASFETTAVRKAKYPVVAGLPPWV